MYIEFGPFSNKQKKNHQKRLPRLRSTLSDIWNTIYIIIPINCIHSNSFSTYEELLNLIVFDYITKNIFEQTEIHKIRNGLMNPSNYIITTTISIIYHNCIHNNSVKLNGSFLNVFFFVIFCLFLLKTIRSRNYSSEKHTKRDKNYLWFGKQ